MASPSYIVVRTLTSPIVLETVLPYERAELAKIGAELRYAPCKTPDEILAAARDADVIIHAGGVKLPRRVIEQLPRCKGIVIAKVGLDNVDIAAATERGIIVANLPDGWTNEVADVALGLFLAVNRQIVALNNSLKSEGWQAAWQAMRTMPAIRTMTLGIIGLGRIGRATALRAQAFGMKVIAYDPLLESHVFASCNVEQVEFEDVLRRSDAVSLHPLLTDRTRGMIDEKALRLMKPGAVLINTARGGVVDEPALIRALQQGWIAGAGLDVMAKEPCDRDNPLLAMDNVVVVPHTAGISTTVADEHRTKPVAEAIRILCGRPPRPEAFVNPEVWTRTTVQE
jgi:D-3-phosphoglycerate dehydrogenase / 2-oxoglutarate reductase